ncbi:MAG: hypothetical protein FJW84_04050 [Actinobacteria bacterium]|nr:hypothetical protein [Actinomycetota bacterium]
MRIRPKLFFAIGIMPRCSLKNLFLRLLGWKIDKSAKIGVNIFWNVEVVNIAHGVRIGSLNVFRDLRHVCFESDSSLGNLNWISASPVFGNLGSDSSIKLGKRSVVTNRHYLDVSGGFSIGAGSALTGVRSTVITHGVNPSSSAQETRMVTIGRNSLIGSNAVIAPGATVGDFQVFGMGSLISGVYNSSFQLHLSKKAIPTRSLLPSSRFFNVFDD